MLVGGAAQSWQVYSTKDFIEEKATIPSSFRGVCDTLGPRFQQSNKVKKFGP